MIEGFSDSADSKPNWLLAELTYACPLQCLYCSNPVDYHHKQELSTQQWLEVFERGRKLGINHLGLSGGEPLERTDLLQILVAAKRLGFRCHLITSAMGLTENKLAHFRQLGLDSVQISFQGSDCATTSQLGGGASFEHKIAMAEATRELGLTLGLNLVLHRHNLHQVAEFLDLASRLGAKHVELVNVQYEGWARQNQAQLLASGEQLTEAKQKVNLFRDQNPNIEVFVVGLADFESTSISSCSRWDPLVVTVAADGEVHYSSSDSEPTDSVSSASKDSLSAVVWRNARNGKLLTEQV